MPPALLVIDFIKGIAKTGTCAEYLSQHPSVIQNANRLIQTFHQKQWPIYAVRLAFDERYQGLPDYSPSRSTLISNRKFLFGSKEIEWIDELKLPSKVQIFNKKAGDPFCGNELLETLKSADVKELVFTGLATDNAILYGANTAMTNHFKVVIASDACGAATLTAHDHALSLIQRTSAYRVATTSEWLEKEASPITPSFVR